MSSVSDSLKLLGFTVRLDDREAVEITVRPADQVVAEQHAPRLGIGTDVREAPLTYTYLWCFFAMKRTGHFEGKWQEFIEQLASCDPVKAQSVDPTKADTSASDSPAPSDSETPPTGSTPA